MFGKELETWVCVTSFMVRSHWFEYEQYSVSLFDLYMECISTFARKFNKKGIKLLSY